MKVLVYGAGAVGLGIAGALLNANVKTDILARNGTYLELVQNGLFVDGIFGKWHIHNSKFNVYTNLNEIDEVYDFILVAVKSNDSKNVAEDIACSKLKNKSKIILLQNGWGNYEIFNEYIDSELIFNGRVITGFIKTRPNCSYITVHADDIKIGNLNKKEYDNVKKLTEKITQGGIPTRYTNEIEKDLWAKMLYNCSLNPLGAIFNVPYGKLKNEFSMKIIKKILDEIFNVMKKCGYSTYWENSEEYFKLLNEELIPKTSSHKSSTLQDLLAGKKTEIDALNGQIVKLGEKFNVEVETNYIIVNMIKFLENNIN